MDCCEGYSVMFTEGREGRGGFRQFWSTATAWKRRIYFCSLLLIDRRYDSI
jgi:hypothetical protein